MKKVTLSQALRAFTAAYAADHTPRTVQQASGFVKFLIRDAGDKALDELTAWDLEHHLSRWVGENLKSRATRLRVFLGWVNARFKTTCPLPAMVRASNLPAVTQMLDRLAREEAQATDVAARLERPAHRAIFLIGYLHQRSLQWIRCASMDDLFALSPQRPDLYALLAEVRSLTRTPKIPFQTWLGRSARTSQEKWSAWSGGVSFMAVMRAGLAAHARARCRAATGRYIPALYWLLPLATEEDFARMPRFWG